MKDVQYVCMFVVRISALTTIFSTLTNLIIGMVVLYVREVPSERGVFIVQSIFFIFLLLDSLPSKTFLHTPWSLGSFRSLMAHCKLCAEIGSRKGLFG